MAEQEKEVAGAAGEEVIEASDFASLLSKEFKPKSDQAKSAVESAVQTLAQQALENVGLISYLKSWFSFNCSCFAFLT